MSSFKKRRLLETILEVQVPSEGQGVLFVVVWRVDLQAHNPKHSKRANIFIPQGKQLVLNQRIGFDFVLGQLCFQGLYRLKSLFLS